MFSFFKKSAKAFGNPLTTDFHSHFLAGIDDGAKNWDDSLAMMQTLQKMGYRKFVTTPHIMSDVYRNEPEVILEKLADLKREISNQGLQIEIEAAAEYYLDEELMRKLMTKEKLLTVGKNSLLFETNFLSEPLQMKEFIFQAVSQGYTVILAHPERYEYMTMEKAEDLRHRGVLFQLNILSIMGFYSRPVQRMAYNLIDRGWVEYLGSDCHNMIQANYILSNQTNKYYQRALQMPLLNNQL